MLFVEMSNCYKEAFLMDLYLFDKSQIFLLHFFRQIILSFKMIYLFDINVLIEQNISIC